MGPHQYARAYRWPGSFGTRIYDAEIVAGETREKSAARRTTSSRLRLRSPLHARGGFDIGPVKATATVLVPRSFGTRRIARLSIFSTWTIRSPIHFSPILQQFLREARSLTLKANPVALEVKPLPPNAPPEFSGAIGAFTMEADAKPKTVQVGDPITVTANISGRGNFDRVSAPVLEDEHGWHKYPPSANFKQDDDVGISGVKTFETVLTPNESKNSVPPFVFSFFDPVNEKYVTLRSNAISGRRQGPRSPRHQELRLPFRNQKRRREASGKTGGHSLSDQRLAGNRGIVRADLHAIEFLVRADCSARWAAGVCRVEVAAIEAERSRSTATRGPAT